MIQIESLDDPRVACFNGLKSKEMLKQGFFIADSLKVINQFTNYRAEKSKRIVKIFGVKNLISDVNHLPTIPSNNIFYAEKKLIEQIVGHRIHQGVMALGEIPSPMGLEELCDHDLILVLNGLTSPENVGEIVRTAVAFGVKVIMFDGKTCHPYLRRCVRVSMGNIGGIDYYKSENLIEDLSMLQGQGGKIVGTANHSSAVSLTQFSSSGKKVVIMGSEGKGIDPSILDLCDETIKININPSVDSLNVASAAGIILHQLTNR